VALSTPLLAAIMAFVFSASPFVALGSLLAYEMDKFPRLVAYGSIDEDGSILDFFPSPWEHKKIHAMCRKNQLHLVC
jgi:hypothetical protein